MPPVPPRPDDIDADNVTPPPPTDAAPAPTPATPAAAPKYLKPSARSVVVPTDTMLPPAARVARMASTVSCGASGSKAIVSPANGSFDMVEFSF